MYKEWLKVFIAAIFEVIWVIGLKHADSVLEWSGTFVAIVISFYFLIMSGQKLPAGTSYAVFVGLGTAGTVSMEMLVFGGEFHLGKILLIVLLLVGVIGLKITTDQHADKGGEA